MFKKLVICASIFIFLFVSLGLQSWDVRHYQIFFAMGYSCGYEIRTVYEKMFADKLSFRDFILREIKMAEKVDRFIRANSYFVRGFYKGFLDRENKLKSKLPKKIRQKLIQKLAELIILIKKNSKRKI